MVGFMTFDANPASFYDELADDYHLIFADWDASIARQAGVIAALLRDHGMTSGAVLDASCGIGTQALGLAGAGFTVTATDISPASVKRCAQEAAARDLAITTAVADLRVLDVPGAGAFDAALSFDNALPHLLSNDGLDAACGSLRRVLRPGGTLLASIRDYDTVLRKPVWRPAAPLRHGHRRAHRLPGLEWESEDVYTVRHFIMDSRAHDWAVTERRTTYRALSRTVLSEALTAAGFQDVTWRMPEQTGFYQPVVSARVMP